MEYAIEVWSNDLINTKIRNTIESGYDINYLLACEKGGGGA